MNKLKKISLVITSINKPNEVIKKYYSLSKNNKINFIIIGDKKTPEYPSKYNFYNLRSITVPKIFFLVSRYYFCKFK
mgnify:CR=1 FL=1